MIKQKDYFAIEPRFLCDTCSIAVTNPICPSCLSLEIEAWLTLYPNLKREILPQIKQYLDRIEDKIVDSTKCITCNQNRVAVCPYCFTDFVFSQLKKANANKVILKEFFEFFNFDFEHNGYCNEAEELGVI
ncbi:MAG: hypothetical protein WC979_06665 [Candidatus Pacearchaeota archaeon]|jgi:predicted Fe-S protein YdhL (DUF1289 family)